MAIQKTAPEALAPVPFQIPVPIESRLDNGLRVVLVEDARIPHVSFRLAFLSGDAQDPAGSPGLTSAMTSLMTEGTENYSSRELAEKIERLGASLHVSSSDDFTVVSASALSMYSDDVFEMMGEVTLRPVFPDDEVDLYRRNTVENLKFQRSQPGFLANERTARILYGDHPYSIISPAASDVEALKREELLALHSQRIVPSNAVFVAVGEIKHDELLSQLNTHFIDWKAGNGPKEVSYALPVREKRSITIVDRPGSAQANIVISDLAAKRNDPDYFPIIVLNQVLGAGASSRVFMNLREEKGYTYGAYTRFDMKMLAGDLEATAEVRTAVAGASLKEFFFELERIRKEPVSSDELADAKSYLTGVFPIRAETQEGLTGLIVNQQLYGLPEDYLQTYRENVNAITAEQVMETAIKYIHPDRSAIVLVGDAAELLPQVSSYADSIEVFDTDGIQKDVASFSIDPLTDPLDLTGEWTLSIDFQGQAVPVTMTLTHEDGVVTGTIETMLGSGKIADGKVTGNKFSASAVTEMQGQSLELTMGGVVSADSINGLITVPIIPEPLPFSGTRAK